MIDDEWDDDQEVVCGKIVLVGDSGVGKTSLAVTYLTNTPQPTVQATVAAAFFSCKVKTDKALAKLQVWDTAGAERYNAVVPLYYRNVDVAFVVFDLTVRSTFVSVRRWISDLKNHAPPSLIIIVVGNKSDLPHPHKVTVEEARNLSRHEGALYVETSAWNGAGVNELFKQAAESVLHLRQASLSQVRQLGSRYGTDHMRGSFDDRNDDSMSAAGATFSLTDRSPNQSSTSSSNGSLCWC